MNRARFVVILIAAVLCLGLAGGKPLITFGRRVQRQGLW